MRKIELNTTGYYHIFSRGVDKRRIFTSSNDYLRFYEWVYLFNDLNYSNPHGSFLDKAVLLSGHEVLASDRLPYVSILSYCLQPNHFHFFIRQEVDGGVSAFFHKLLMAYSKDFNRRYKRNGSLFEGPFKAVEVKNESHFQHLIRYIHLNVLDEEFPMWRNGKLKNWNRAKEILASYPWSSHPQYMGEKEKLPILDMEFVNSAFSSTDEYLRFLQLWAGRDLVFETALE